MTNNNKCGKIKCMDPKVNKGEKRRERKEMKGELQEWKDRDKEKKRTWQRRGRKEK